MPAPTTTPAATPAATSTTPKKVSKKQIAIAVIGVLLIIFFTWPAKTEEEKAREASKQVAPESQPTSGVVIAIPGVWQGFTCVDGTKHANYNILVDNVYWEVRFDRDDNRIRPMYPRNLNPGSYDKVPVSANVFEFRIKPGQVKSAPIAWSLNNRRT